MKTSYLILSMILTFILLSLCSTITFADVLFVEPDAGTAPLINIIDKVKKEIKLSLYEFTQSKGKPNPILRAIARARKRGVSVSIILNQFVKDGWPSYGPYILKSEMRWCKKNNITCIPASRQFTYSHNKYFLIDNTTAIIMTNNLTKKDFSHSRNFILSTDDTLTVHFLEKLFVMDLQNAQNNTKQSPKLIPKKIILSPTNSLSKITRFINETQHSLDIYAMYFDKHMPRGVITALKNAAKRHVKIRILTNAAFPQKTLLDLAHSNQNIDVKFIDNKKKHFFIHAKVLLRDNKAAILGSLNMSHQSFFGNRELSYLMNDTKKCDTIRVFFEHDWELSS